MATEYIMVRITAEQRDRVDALRDPLIPREAYVRQLLDSALDLEERTGHKKHAPAKRRTAKNRTGR